MRDKFTELINAGVASFKHEPVAPAVSDPLDTMVRLYNGCWGALSDTHMSRVDGGYIITGTFVKSDAWNRFKYANCWGSTNIKLGSGYCSLDHMVWTFGYEMKPDIYNGDNVIRLVPRAEGDASAPAAEECPATGCVCPCACAPAGYYTTCESQIPQPIGQLFNSAEKAAFVEAWVDARGDAKVLIENLNNSKVLDGSKFRLSTDGEYLIAAESYKIKLN